MPRAFFSDGEKRASFPATKDVPCRIEGENGCSKISVPILQKLSDVSFPPGSLV